MSRKGKTEVFEAKILEFEGHIDTVEGHLRGIHLQLEQKAESDLVDLLRNDKLSCADLESKLPGHLALHSLAAQMEEIVRGKMAELTQGQKEERKLME